MIWRPVRLDIGVPSEREVVAPPRRAGRGASRAVLVDATQARTILIINWGPDLHCTADPRRVLPVSPNRLLHRRVGASSRRRSATVLLAASLVSATLAGCSAGADSSTEGAGGTALSRGDCAHPRHRRHLRWRVRSPQGVGTRPSQIRPIHSSLLKVDSAVEFVGDLATEHTISEDGLVWTLPLRTDAAFSNGEPVTARDVVFTYELLREDGIQFDLSFVKRIEAPDERTLATHQPAHRRRTAGEARHSPPVRDARRTPLGRTSLTGATPRRSPP